MSEILKGLADNEALSEAVKELLIKQFSVDNLESTMADIELGQMVKARLVGLKAIDKAFQEIKQYQSTPKQGDKVNPAR